MSTVLVAGATGATGSLVTRQLLERGHRVKAVVRSPHKLPEDVRNSDRLMVIEAPILDIPSEDLARHVRECDAVISCLGHNLTFKGIYGKPRKLVRDAVRRLCASISKNHPDKPVKVILMNTSGNRNRDLNERVSAGHRIVVALLRLLLPPHPDNEQAAEHLRVKIGQGHAHIEWVAVRPDSLIDAEAVSPYTLHPSPTRDAIFNAGKTSRINVAHFITSLVSEDDLWQKWKGQMPIIYNAESAS